MAITYLPPEILIHIFSLIPVKALCNVILVNKFWLRLISSPDFARAHLQHSKQGKTNLSEYRCIFSISCDGLLLQQFAFESIMFNSSSVSVIDLDCPKNKLGRSDVTFVGSCDGLVCFEKEENVFLWNPCTGKYNKLPHPRLYLDTIEGSSETTYGFGYDESTNDYKVVALCKLGSKACSVVNVWSSKRNSWKRIKDFRGCVSHTDMGKLISGKIHWLTHHKEDGRKDTISFDVGREVFGIVEHPSNYGVGDYLETQLDVLDGCICLLLSSEGRRRADLWVMKEYGVKESWTKVVTISCVNILNRFISCSILPNGEILFTNMECFAVYNPEDNSFRFLGVQRSSCIFEPIMYVQSLVSPVV